MASTLAVLFLSLALPSALAAPSSSAKAVCDQIKGKITGQSSVIYPLNLDFTPDIHHWFLTSSEVPACVLEAGSTDDVATAIQLIGQNQTPFAVYSGGHASNPGFSSTNGVHITLKMDQVQLSPDKSTVEVGFGQAWPDVYKALDGSGVNVVGGRVPGPGVGGFTLGGGFSWKTNQGGLTCDTVKSFNLVLPNGTISTVDNSQPDLFFALKGGLNRFGVVTSAVFNTLPQPPEVYAGFNIYTPGETPDILNATNKFFEENKDPKAQIITTLSGTELGTAALVLFFYDGPKRPSAFDSFNSIVPLTLLQNLRTQSFSSFVSGVPSSLTLNARGTFDTVSTTKLTPKFLAAVKEESDKYGDMMALHGATMVSFDIEPFDPNFGKYATDSAYPHADSPLPLNLYFAWLSPTEDAFWYQAMKDVVSHLIDVAKEEGIYVPIKYPNYSISGTSAETLYGAKNAARLRSIRQQVDPNGIMELAGGFAL